MQQSQRETALFAAIRANDTSKVVEFLNSGVNPNIREPRPRHTFDNFPNNLLNTRQGKSEEQTPLLAALYKVDRSKPNMSAITFNRTPNPDIIRALLSHGANAMDRNTAEHTPICCAVLSGKLEVVDMLIRHGAIINDKDDTALLLMEAATGRIEIMEYLLSHGAEIKARDAYGQTALIYNVRYIRKPDAIKFLLDNHAELDAKDKGGKTALYYAQHPSPMLAPSQTRQLPEIVKMLKKAGAI